VVYPNLIPSTRVPRPTTPCIHSIHIPAHKFACSPEMAPQTDGFYLVNCSKSFSEPVDKHPPGTVDLRIASGIAYYADVSPSPDI
jgi:hypothetical protein